ncbi:MAG: tetratricopeptide repeat protein [Spirochaetes bacterium]|nr:tetratricopeptide repeat protein [Spirochaetota bacterium]
MGKIICGYLKVPTIIRYRIFSVFVFTVLLSAPAAIFCQSRPQSGNTNNRQQPPSGLVEEIRSLTETGRLSSMLEALELIRSRDISGVDFGRMMIGINTLLIKLVYPDSPVQLPVIDLPQTFNYTRIIREAEKGVYVRPSETSDDFFEHILVFLAINEQTKPEVLSDIFRNLVKAGQLKPNSLLPPYLQGLIHERLGRLEQAEAAYRRAYEMSNECYPALMNIARIKSLSGNTAEALSLFSDLVIRYPNSAGIKRQLAVVLLENGDLSRALSAIDELLFSAPREGELLLIKTRILIEQGQFSQANAILDTYASINSNNRDYLFYRARVQAEGNKNRDAAINYLRSILRTNANDTETLLYAASLLLDSARPADRDEGKGLLARLQRTSGSSIEVMNLSLEDAIRRESWKEAQAFLNRILAVRRTPADLINAYQVERNLGDNAKALAFARELYEKNTSNNEYIVVLISALIDSGRRAEASQMIESRINSVSGGSVKAQYYYLRSRIQPNDEAALSDLRSSIFEDPRNLDALIATFEIYRRQREERRAVYYLRQALAIAPDNPRLKRYEKEYAELLKRN